MPKIAKIYGFYIQLKTSLNSRIFKDVFQFMPKFQDFPGFSRTASKFQGFSGFSRTLATLTDHKDFDVLCLHNSVLETAFIRHRRYKNNYTDAKEMTLKYAVVN